MPAHRRDFLKQSAALAVALLHTDAAAGQSTQRPPAAGAPRLRAFTLETRAPLGEMRRFYHDAIGLPVVEDSSARLTIGAGSTRVTFVPQTAAGRDAFYHFAFNIPENKIEAAAAWQKQHGPLLPIPERLRDARHSADVVNYAHWNAHSVFFLDPGGNVVEYIARHELPNARPGGFGPSDILHASELAFIVDDVPAVAERLRQGIGIGNYLRGGDANFMALGDAGGLVLVMRRGRILNFARDSQEKAAGVFPTAAVVGGRAGAIRIDGFPYELTVEAPGA